MDESAAEHQCACIRYRCGARSSPTADQAPRRSAMKIEYVNSDFHCFASSRRHRHDSITIIESQLLRFNIMFNCREMHALFDIGSVF